MHHHVRIYEQGQPEVLKFEQAPALDAKPAPGHVRLRQEAIGLNFVDTMFRDGTFTVPLPFIPGVEGAGIVEATADDVHDIRPGQRVAYFYAPGAYTELRDIPVKALAVLPDDVSTRVAAAIFAKGLTAWMAIRRVHRIEPGQLVYVTGAASGVGSLVARWAQAIGATVIAAVGSDAKVVQARRIGLRHVVLTGSAKFAQDIHDIIGNRQVDVVYEFVGRETFAQSGKLLRDGGSLVHVGNASGSASVDRADLKARSIRYAQPSTPQYVGDRESLREAATDLFDAVRSGVFGELFVTSYPLGDVVLAHKDIASRRVFGLPILVP